MKLSILTFFIFILFGVQAQFTPQFNTYIYNGLAINPAYAGSRECLSITAVHNSQWVGLNGAPTTDYLSLHTPLKKNHAIGLNMFNDRIGIQNHTGFYPSYAYHLRINKKQHLSFGVSAGFSYLQTRESEIKTVDSDNLFYENSSRFYFPNIGTGLYYYSEKFFIGLSLPLIYTKPISQPTNSQYNVQLSNTVYSVTAGTLIKLKDKLFLKPSVLYSNLGNNFHYASFNANLYIKEKIYFGAGYILNNSFTALFGFQLNERFEMAYNYAFQNSLLRNYAKGTHEIMLRYEFRKKVSSLNSRYF